MSTLRPIGVGSKTLIHGDKIAGFYGEVIGIITADKLRSIAGVAQGTAMQTGDIAWLKFSHNYKTLYIAKQPIQHSISWDYLQEKDLMFGKMVEIGGSAYLLRLMQGANSSPAGASGGCNSEWDNLFEKVRIGGLWNVYDSNELGLSSNGRVSWCQEVSSIDLLRRIGRQDSGINANISSLINIVYGWRPVLELLY